MQTESVEVFAGIDVSKKTLDLDCYPVPHRAQFPNDAGGHQALAAKLQQLGPSVIIVEETGGLETELVSCLVSAAWPVAVINPKQARDSAKAMGVLAKTDSVNAAVLARFGHAVKPKLRPIKSEELRQLEEVLTRR